MSTGRLLPVPNPAEHHPGFARSASRGILSVLTLVVLLSGSWQQAMADSPETRNQQPFAIDADYPGGNIILERIEGDTVYLRQDLRDTEGWWFYWNFRVRGVTGRTLRFVFTNKNPIGVRGPAVSTDAGRTWAWLGTEKVKAASFSYVFPPDIREVRFCFAIPYQQSDLQRFLARHADCTNLTVRQLCRTRHDRGVERIHVGRLDGRVRFRVLLTARHHACESIASYALEGLLDAVLAETDDGLWFRRNVEIMAVPFMDKDGVEEGDQGKNRRPHDHYCDYIEKGIYPSVTALRTFVPDWSKGKLRVALDLHCPYIKGSCIYLVGNHDERIWAEQQRFSIILEDVRTGPLPYRPDDNLPFGRAWNTHANYGSLKTCSQWASELDGIKLAATIEIPYADVRGNAVTAETARAFGADLARALRAYLQLLEPLRLEPMSGSDAPSHRRR